MQTDKTINKEKKISKKNISQHLSRKFDIEEEVLEKMIGKTFEYISKSLINGQTVSIREFGTFRFNGKKSKNTYNFKKKRTELSIKNRVKFVLSESLWKKLNP